MLSLIALVYTNDLFTAFVFIEINTLAAAGLVMMRQHGRALVAGVRYMMMTCSVRACSSSALSSSTRSPAIC